MYGYIINSLSQEASELGMAVLPEYSAADIKKLEGKTVCIIASGDSKLRETCTDPYNVDFFESEITIKCIVLSKKGEAAAAFNNIAEKFFDCIASDGVNPSISVEKTGVTLNVLHSRYQAEISAVYRYVKGGDEQ